jgi:predicted DNA-binding ribbon-helix-helix protein
MRTTIDLPDLLFRELKAMAASRGTLLKAIVRNAVEEETAESGAQTGAGRNFPVRLRVSQAVSVPPMQRSRIIWLVPCWRTSPLVSPLNRFS